MAVVVALVAAALPRAAAGQDRGYTLDLCYTTVAGQPATLKRATVTKAPGEPPVISARSVVSHLPAAAGVVVGTDGEFLVSGGSDALFKVNPLTGAFASFTAAPGPAPGPPALSGLLVDSARDRLWAAAGPGQVMRTALPRPDSPAPVRAVAGADRDLTHLAWIAGRLFYAAKVTDEAGGPPTTALGTLDPEALSTRRVLSGFPQARALVVDPHSAQLMVFCDRWVIQVDPGDGQGAPVRVMGSLDLGPALGTGSIVGAASDGRGRLVAVSSAGLLIVLELGQSRSVSDAGTVRRVLTLEAAGGVTALAPLSGDGSARTTRCVWENGPWDGVNGQLSQVSAPNGDPRTADDFYLLPGEVHRIDRLTAALISDTLVPSARLELYEDRGGFPGALRATIPAASVTDTGQRYESLKVYRAVFSPEDLWLEGGRTYWVSAVGVGRLSGTDLWYWGTTGTGAAELKGTAGRFRAPALGYPDWVSVEELGCGCTDFAFTVEGDSCKVLHDNGAPDPAAGAPSVLQAPSHDALSADNFVVPPASDSGGVSVCYLRAYLYSNCDPVRGRFQIFESDCGGPSGLTLFSAPFDRVTDLGYTVELGGETLRAYRVEAFDLEWLLARGRNYWLTAFGEAGGALRKRAYLAHSIRCDAPVGVGGAPCDVSFGQGVVIGVGVGRLFWTPVEFLAGRPRDFAFLIGVRNPRPDPVLATPLETCAADADRSGTVTILDIFVFLAAYFEGCP